MKVKTMAKFDISAAIDETIALQAKVDKVMSAARAKVAADEARIKELNDLILSSMNDTGSLGISTAVGEAKIESKQRISIIPDEYDKLEAFVYKKKALFLFGRSPLITAYRELLEDNPNGIPGIREYLQPVLKVAPLKGAKAAKATKSAKAVKAVKTVKTSKATKGK